MADGGETSSSDSDDQEYFPEGDVPSSCSEVSEGEPEKGVGGGRGGGGRVKGGGGRKRARRKQKPQQQEISRKRRGGIRLEESTVKGSGADKSSALGDSDHSSSDSEEEEEGGGETVEREREGRDRARIDDLWASFKMDVGFKPRPSPGAGSPKSVSSKPEQPKTVTIKETYDFAGEEVVVEKEVAADSREARIFLKSQAQQLEGEQEGTFATGVTMTTTASSTPPVSASSKSIIAGMKRSSGLSSVLQSIGKKPKMSTLEKSQLDWVKYKREEGLQDELTQHSKDGYLEKQDFLYRADLRQFELEREERLKRFRRLH